MIRLSTRGTRAAAAALAIILAACGGESPTDPGPTNPPPPPPPDTSFRVPVIAREFRGMWIATVANIDWPSRSTLTAAQQQGELAQLMDVAVNARLNAVILQVRAAGDALYPSALEPWARSLTGTQGTDPGYDPLAFAVQQARQRGVELHAWFNPFRAGSLGDTLRLASTHLAVRRPDLVRRHCGQLWFDPGEQAVQDHAIAVVKDVLARYDVDAVHIDDFFYPYPSGSCTSADFPDDVPYQRYTQAGGTMGRADWRRDNVNRFVRRLYEETHAVAPTVKVGVSPFGIWRPGSPTGITGLDAYATIYADSRLWLQQGWVDYFAPQLYWSTASTGQNYNALLTWWSQQNTQRRHLWPGLASYRIADGSSAPYAANEIPTQIALARQTLTSTGSTGTILYNGSSVRDNRGGFVTALTSGLFANRALVPASTWLDNTAPPTPVVNVNVTASAVDVSVGPATADTRWWLVRWRTGTGTTAVWTERVYPAGAAVGIALPTSVNAVVVNAVDRAGNASEDALWRR